MAAKKRSKQKRRSKKRRASAQIEKTIYVGVDVGTSRSAVSSSSGERHLVQSYVGWPKDFVAAKMLGDRVLVGEEALEQRLSVNLVRPLAAGVLKGTTAREEESVLELIGALLSLAAPDSNAALCAAVGVPAQTLQMHQRDIQQAIGQYTQKSTLLSEPFAVAYGLDVLTNALVIDIGAGTVDFCLLHGSLPTDADQRSLSTAGDHIDQQLYDLLSEAYPESNFTLDLVRGFKEAHAFVGPPRKKAIVEAPVHGAPMSHDITEDLRRACESIMGPIVETTMELIGNFDPALQQRVRGRIILAGGGSGIAGIEKYLERALEDFAPCVFNRVEDPAFAGADGALKYAVDMPDELWSR